MPTSIEDFATGLDKQGVPGDWIELLGYLFREVLDGRNAHLANGVQRALGREPKDFADYVRDAARHRRLEFGRRPGVGTRRGPGAGWAPSPCGHVLRRQRSQVGNST